MAKIKKDRVTDWPREQAIAMRTKKKMTYQEIADTMGVSKTYVYLLLKDTVKNKHFKNISEERMRYPELVKWMNENQVSQCELARRMGYALVGRSHSYISNKISTGNLRKNDVDKLLEITGMSYEKLFGGTA